MWPTDVERVLPSLFTVQADKEKTKTTNADTLLNTMAEGRRHQEPLDRLGAERLLDARL